MGRLFALLAVASAAANVAANPLLVPAKNDIDHDYTANDLRFAESTTTAPDANFSPLSPEIGAISTEQLFGRAACANPCGWTGQLCCQSNERCYTDSNDRAQCSQTAADGLGAGVWSIFTTRIIRTDTTTVTEVGSTFIPASTAAVAPAPGASICNYDQLETPCGAICCAAAQYCVASGQCVAETSAIPSAAPTPTGAAGTVPFGAPIAASSANGGQAGGPTTTVPFTEPVATGVDPNSAGGAVGGVAGGSGSGGGSGSSGTDSSGASSQSDMAGLTRAQSDNGGLSGGAIAGIVIGSIAGIILLAALCVCCFIKGLWDVIFGRRRRRQNISNRQTNYYAAGRRPSRAEHKHHWGPAAALAGLAAALGFRHHEKNKNRRRQNTTYNDYESDYASYRGGGGPQYSNQSSYNSQAGGHRYPPRSADPRSPASARDDRTQIITEEKFYYRPARRT